jgi:hypothetical protein
MSAFCDHEVTFKGSSPPYHAEQAVSKGGLALEKRHNGLSNYDYWVAWGEKPGHLIKAHPRSERCFGHWDWSGTACCAGTQEGESNDN